MKSNQTETGGSNKSSMKQLENEGKKKLEQAKEKTKQQLEEHASEAKTEAASRLETYAAAVQAAADKLREQDETSLGENAGYAADQIERFAGYLREKDTGRLLRDLRGMARQNPEWFLGGSLLAGLAIGRFLRASAGPDDDAEYSTVGGNPKVPARYAPQASTTVRGV